MTFHHNIAPPLSCDLRDRVDNSGPYDPYYTLARYDFIALTGSAHRFIGLEEHSDVRHPRIGRRVHRGYRLG